MGGACLLGYGDLEHFCAGVKNLGSETAVEYLSCVQFHLYAPVMLLTVLIALWSILISAYTSAMWAAKVDPMQAAQFGKPAQSMQNPASVWLCPVFCPTEPETQQEALPDHHVLRCYGHGYVYDLLRAEPDDSVYPACANGRYI